MSKELIKKLAEGKIIYVNNELAIDELTWNNHPKFNGVSLKHLVKGESTKGKFSCHLVKIEAGCEIGEHIHEDKWELHEVIAGKGKGILIEKEIDYEIGISVIIPEGVKHKVVADEGDLYLLAKFIPALI